MKKYYAKIWSQISSNLMNKLLLVPLVLAKLLNVSFKVPSSKVPNKDSGF